MQVSESVHIIELGLPFQDTPILNVFVIKGKKSSIVIDTGMGDKTSNELLLRGIEKLGMHRDEVTFILNTHEHVEHFSGNYALVAATGAKIIAHPIAAQIIKKPVRRIPEEDVLDAFPEEAARQLKEWGEFFRMIKPTQVAREVNEGDVIELDGTKLRVIYTPGHAQGHICLYDEERKTLFSGDHVLGSGTPYVGQWPDGSNGNMRDYINSLKKLRRLDMRLILPSHGPIVTEPYSRIDETIERKMKREEEIIQALERGGRRDLWSLTKEVYKCSPNDAYYYSSCVLAYLSKLRDEGKVEYSIKGFDISCKLKR
jgi:glyoxylase-like metal-dependent hydrolase (beta-lactamase superfamily II)